MTANLLTDQLKSHTATSHQQLEKQLVTRMRAIRSTEGYVQLLQLFYGYFGALEEGIDELIAAKLDDYKERRKTEALTRDIRSLGATTHRKATPDELPAIDSVASAFGAMYVMEGSTLGGGVIAAMIGKQLGESVTGSLSFFNGYGAATPQKWARFKDRLNTFTGDAEAERQAVQAADETFRKFTLWIGKHDGKEKF